MERRLLTFIVASTAFFFCYAWLRIMFAPPVAEPQGNAAVELLEEASAEPVVEIVTDGREEQETETASRSDPTSLSG